jgi:hypothetical protein
VGVESVGGNPVLRRCLVCARSIGCRLTATAHIHNVRSSREYGGQVVASVSCVGQYDMYPHPGQRYQVLLAAPHATQHTPQATADPWRYVNNFTSSTEYAVRSIASGITSYQ